jgi:hypothetical protein
MSITLQSTKIDGNHSLRTAQQCACGDAPLPPSARGREPLTLLPAIALVLLPKCPLCLATWLGIFGSFGSSTWLGTIWGTPLAVGLLSFAVISLALRARGSRNARPLLLGLTGAAVMLIGRYVGDPPLAIYSGLSLMTVAVFWSSWSGTKTIQQDPTVSQH